MPKIYFVDVTNRDGVQTSRLGLAKLQKTYINLMLDDMGITQSEFGFPTTKHELNYLNANLDLVKRGVITKTKLSGRKATMLEMSNNGNRTSMKFSIPARGLIGFRSEFIRMTRGEGIMYHTFDEYKPFAGDIPKQRSGSILAHEQGEAIPYALAQFEDRGVFYIYKPNIHNLISFFCLSFKFNFLLLATAHFL